jgi:hypothetical protein
MKKSLLTFFQLASLVILCLSMASGIALAESGGIGGRPARPDPSNERTKSIFIKTVSPGQSASDEVEVVNNSQEKKSVLVYPTDSVPSSGGAFACAQAVDTSSAVGSWIIIPESEITLLPGESKRVPFTVKVPTNASIGEQNGCIVLQEKRTVEVQGGIGLNFRTAIRVAVLVPGQVEKSLAPLSIQVNQQKNIILITPEVKNTGNVSLDTDVVTKVKTMLGTTIATQKNTFPVLRDQLTQWNFEFEKPFWGGWYTGTYELTFDQSSEGFLRSSRQDPKTISGQSKIIFVAPHPVAALIEITIIGAFGMLLFYLRRKRGHSQAVRDHWTTYRVQKGDDIESVAEKYAINWKKLALSNSLKAPYTLSAGQRIKVPKQKPTRQGNNRTG